MKTYEWIKHTPPHCPVSPNTIVIAKLEDGYVCSPMEAQEISWDCFGDDVLEYKIVTSDPRPH